jgi:hypothetical protein
MATKTNTKTNTQTAADNFQVVESKTDFVQAARGRAAAPNPLLPAVETGMANRGKSYDVHAGSEAKAKKIVNLLRRASKSKDVSLRIQIAPDNSAVKFAVRAEKITRTRKPKESAAA